MEHTALEGAVGQTLNRMMSYCHAGSEKFKTEDDHQNIKKLTALFFVMPVHYYFDYIEWVCEMNKLKNHPRGIGTQKKNSCHPIVRTFVISSPLCFF